MGELGYYNHYQEQTLGLLQVGVRYYDPQTGRFTQQDPIGDGVNWYGYCGGNPVNAVDPSGLEFWPKFHGSSRTIRPLVFHAADSGEAYPYDSNWNVNAGWAIKRPNRRDRIDRSLAYLLIGQLGRIRPGSVKLFRHFLNGKGAPIKIDVGTMIRKCPYAKIDYSVDLKAAVDTAMKLAPRPNKPYRLLSNIETSEAYGYNSDWDNRIGGFKVFAEAFATVTEHNGKKHDEMKFTWFVRDPWECDVNGGVKMYQFRRSENVPPADDVFPYHLHARIISEGMNRNALRLGQV